MLIQVTLSNGESFIRNEDVPDGESAYELAHELGKFIANKGFLVATGNGGARFYPGERVNDVTFAAEGLDDPNPGGWRKVK
jgi:hypothetical protein